MWIKACIIAVCILLVGAAAWHLVPWFELQRWAAQEQRAFQNAMAGALRGIQAGDPLAIWALCTATAAYGFFHALGPGHGKVLIGGAALASNATLKRLGILTVLSSLAQAATAILLVGGLSFLLKIGSGDLANLTEVWLAPASYGAIAMIGGVLALRGLRGFFKMNRTKHASHGCCGHAHGPSITDVTTLTSRRDTLGLIASIALRPCTGALFVLVIAARFDAFAAGCLAVITMGLGTATFNMVVATSGVVARRLAGFGTHNQEGLQTISATLHVAGGTAIFAISIGMLLTYLP
ncbi:hypothetical protein [Roseobacter sp.]|uniref:nickel/cobalt transporter n=1 Tax=Roseobacter sp. TaxID=1907202 RepID=UPI00329A3A57